MKRIFTAIILTASIVGYVHAADNSDSSTRKERNYIREGNSLYDEKRFADAEVAYRKALEENAMSETAMYNLAAALIRQSGNADPNSDNNPMSEAQSLLQGVAQSAQDISIAEKAFYNLGNMAFNQQQYDQAINMYKGALRKNPDNDKARENLRLAQLKRQEQQNQDQNQDKNQGQNQDKNEDKDQNKDQNQDQNKDQNQDKQDQQQNQPKEQDINQQTADQILQAMENKENQTRARIGKGNNGEKSRGHTKRRKNW